MTQILGSAGAVAVWPTPGLRVNFFPGLDVLFDFDYRDLRDQSVANVLCELIRVIGQLRELGW